VPEVKPFAAALGPLARRNVPVFLTGDFNSPSHLDWTPAAVAARPALRFPFVWPASKAIADAGLRDSFRTVHPDPVATPGLTWTPGRPYPYVPAKETVDRIDFVWGGGAATPVSSEIVGEPGNPAVAIPVDPYPSDHRAVVSEFRVEPAVPPALVATDRPSVTAGRPLVVRFSVPSNGDWQVAIVPRGAGAGRALVSAGTTAGPGSYADRPSMKLGTLGMKAGEYDALLLDAQGRALARDRFTVLARGARPSVAVAKRTVRPGEPIGVRWRNAPGWRDDWVAVAKAGTPDVFDYVGYVYTGARVAGSETFTKDDLGKLAKGDYVVRLLRDDHYDVLAQARFSVR
jgi:Endonuclease/Exonuclease/phosphatase family